MWMWKYTMSPSGSTAASDHSDAVDSANIVVAISP
ncbi:hypothetical protein EDD19_11181 [Dietzia cinnamea]|uniref:Uncharacterized protein n=1 Tax=Dietzia cinnamea TaxID=321318 RepID=A0A4R3ZTM6_9ACTN|nr:hypothetical protein EDD19_11181 [Dietzia cinnamea]